MTTKMERAAWKCSSAILRSDWLETMPVLLRRHKLTMTTTKNHQVGYDYHGDGNNERVKQELSCQPATERQSCGKQTEFHV